MRLTQPMARVGVGVGLLWLSSCGTVPPGVADSEGDAFLGINVSKFDADRPIPVRHNAITFESNEADLPDDLLRSAPEEVAMVLNAGDLSVNVDTPAAGAPIPTEQHAILTFRLAAAGEDACASAHWIGPFALTVTHESIVVDVHTVPLTQAAQALVRSGKFEICAQSSADFDGIIVVHKLFLEFGQPRADAQRVEICHIPPGDPDNAHTITVGASAVDAHLAHGDYLGPCAEDPPADTDADGVVDPDDLCPDTAPGAVVDTNGCSCDQLGTCVSDADGDGVADTADACPNTPVGDPADYRGCSCAQRDGDLDGVNDCLDLCPGTLAGIKIDADGCPVAELDGDADGVIDGSDACPATPAGQPVDVAGCSCSQLDEDTDGVNTCDDLCPNTPAGTVVDGFGCEVVVAEAGEDRTIENVGPVTLGGSASGGEPPYTYSWSAPGWAGSSLQNPTVMPTGTTTYTLTVTDWSLPPKTATDTVTITLRAQDNLGYNIINLGSLSTKSSYPSGINDAGDVVGYGYTETMTKRAFLYSGGSLLDLGTLGGTEAYARDINNVGQVVGQSRNGSGAWRAFLWDSVHGMRDLGTLGGPNSVAYAINDSGQVAGYASDGTTYHAFLYSAGVMTDLGPLDSTYSSAYGLNGQGQTVGSYMAGGNEQQVFLYDNGIFMDLGSPLLTGSQAWAINDAGMVAGYSWGSIGYRSFLYFEGLVVDLGATDDYPDIYVNSINEAGQVTGYMSNAAGTLSHALIYTGGRIHDLNDLLAPGHGWEYLTAAFAINNQGQIAGYGRIGGQYRAFLLTPNP